MAIALTQAPRVPSRTLLDFPLVLDLLLLLAGFVFTRLLGLRQYFERSESWEFWLPP